jgi:hypothetical protein
MEGKISLNKLKLLLSKEFASLESQVETETNVSQERD